MHVYLIAGEQSGDLLGARLMQALKTKRGDDVSFSGIGGPQMAAEGLISHIPMSELAMMGFVEILPAIPRLLGHIKTTVQDITNKKPDVVITIDSPGFCFRVVKALRKQFPKGAAGAPRMVHYVAPSVWAYKPGRAKKVAALYDQLLTLLPFEPPYFEKEGLKADFVGHPLVENPQEGDGEAFRTRYAIAEDAPLVTALPGSRMGEMKRHMPILRQTAERLLTEMPDVVMTMPVVPHLKKHATAMTENWPCPLKLVDAVEEKWDAFAASNAAIAKSGTVTLELALADTPMVVYYKVHPLSAWLMRKMMLIPYVTLINILHNELVVPEALQENATPEKLAAETLALLQDGSKQTAKCQEALKMLGLGAERTPSEKAANLIADI